MDTDTPKLDYRTPQPEATRGEIFSMAGFVAGMIVASALAIGLLVVTPRFEVIFRDFGTKLPAVTMILLTVSRIARRGGWVLLPMLPVATGFLVALLGRISPPPDPAEAQARARCWRTWVARLTFCALLLIAIVTAVAMFAPMIALIDAVSGSGKK